MQVLQITTDFPYRTTSGVVTQGGGGACVAQLTQALLEKGTTLEIVTSRAEGSYEEIFDVPIHRTSFFDLGFRESKFLHFIPATMTSLNLISKKHFDLIHSHNPTAGIAGCKLSKIYGLPHIMTLHGPWADVRQNKLFRIIGLLIECMAAHLANYVTCDSGALREMLIDRYGIRKEKVIAIPNAIDTKKFDQKNVSKESARGGLGINTKDRIVLYTGRFVEEKGLSYLLEASKGFLKNGVTLLLLGGGYDEEMVRGWAERNPELRNKIIVIPYLPYEKVINAYMASDVFVLPSLAEGLSRSLMEAMSCSLPVVATSVGGNIELLPKDCGVLVESRNSEELCAAIVDLLGNEEKAKKFGKAARERILKNYSIEKRVSSFLQLYSKITE